MFSFYIPWKLQKTTAFLLSSGAIEMEYWKKKQKKTNFMTLFYGWSSTVSRLQIHNEETVNFLPSNSLEFLVLSWSDSEGWKAELTLEPLSGFETGTPGLEIQHLNH